MLIRTIALAAVAAVTLSSTAHAQSFTYMSKGDAPMVAVGATGPDGKPFGASAFGGTGETTMAGGAKNKYSYKCVSMSQPPRDSIYMAHMICDVAADGGTYAAVFGCNEIAAQDMACVGGLYGKTGSYTGKRGTVSGRAKGPNGNGTGQWFE